MVRALTIAGGGVRRHLAAPAVDSTISVLSPWLLRSLGLQSGEYVTLTFETEPQLLSFLIRCVHHIWFLFRRVPFTRYPLFLAFLSIFWYNLPNS